MTIEAQIREIVREEVSKILAQRHEPVAEKATSPSKAVKNEHTVTEVKAAILELGAEKGKSVALSLIKSLGVNRVDEIDPSLFPKVMEKVSEARR